MSNLEKKCEEIFRMEFYDIQARLNEPRGSLHESYLLGISDGIVMMATHLGIVLRPDLLEDAHE